MLKVSNLVKDYKTGFWGKRVRVLYDVSFSVGRGEIYGFIGHNGAGKTTTFKAVLGFAEVTSGTIELMGRREGDVEARRRIGYLPENPYFYDYLTGEELLRYMGELHGLRGRALSLRVGELLEKVGLGNAGRSQLRRYSKGMLQRIGFAQALVNDPDFLILDEPMSGLDPIGQREIRELILELKRKGKTILLSSHILSDVEALCDRVGVIVRGRVVKEGELSHLLREVGTSYEMVVDGGSGVIREKLDGVGVDIEERAGVTVLKFAEDVKPQVLRLVMGLNCNVVSLSPQRKSLEGLFLEETMRAVSK